jgi:hypothetical protein
MLLADELRFVFVLSFANYVAADSGDDFSNNLFSDLAPYVTHSPQRLGGSTDGISCLDY